jgi:hypothetical protein
VGRRGPRRAAAVPHLVSRRRPGPGSGHGTEAGWSDRGLPIRVKPSKPRAGPRR